MATEGTSPAPSPRVVVADQAGACYGVNRALEMVERAAVESASPVRTLGPLIHNPTVVSELEARGVGVVERPEDACGATLVLRTHGVTPDEEARARAACVQVIDATCPFVVRAHDAAARLTAEGYQVIVVGEAGHPEVEGTLGHAPGAVVVSGPDELAAVKVGRKVGLVVQTTQSRELLRSVVAALVGRCAELRLVDTICEATSERQRAARELAARSDAMVVIGGRNSANTTRLAEICAASCARTHHIEGAGELEGGWFEGASAIGVTAGASTPQRQIDEVVAAIRSLVGVA